MNNPFISKIIGDCVAAAAAKLGITIYYDFGHYNEVARNLVSKGKDIDKPNKYPLVWLVLDAEEKEIPVGGIGTTIAKIPGHILIAQDSKPNLTANEREVQVFEPILIPIYEELMNQIRYSKDLNNSLRTDMTHSKWNRYYWGGQDSNGNGQANLFNEIIDAVQVKGLTLNIRKQNCKPFSIK